MLRSHAALSTFTLALLFSGFSIAQELRIEPSNARLVGPKSSQGFVVGAVERGTWVSDLTGKATFRSDRPGVVKIDSQGNATPVANGSAIITAQVGDKSVSAAVSVENFDRDEPWSFRNHVEPVLTKAGCNQGACHGAAAGKNGFRLSLRGYAPEVDHLVLTRQALGRRIVPTAPAESLLLLKGTAAIEHGGGVRFRPESLEYRVIAEWIAAGSPAPSPSDSQVTSLRVYPDSVRLKAGSIQPFLVQAVFSNGRIEDVTRWAKYASTDETVAKVDDRGVVKVEGHGEASMTVWYSSQVARATVTSPYESAIDPKVFRDAPRFNPIDEKNLAKLESLAIPPSGAADDAAFIRRATLDATGTLPTPDQVRAYLVDSDPEKRVKLVDRLLSSSEFVDYWAYKWSDLFLVSSNRLPSPAMWSFYRFVRQSVEQNEPWDKLSRSIITAKGSTLSNGAANYFALHRDPVDITESSSMAFLGMSLTCARCHNHPLEKWTQDQYYGMASLFARVKLKDGGSPGDVVVLPSPEGETHHPRTGKTMAPQPLDAEALPIDAAGDRRDAFADWLARPDNPYFTRSVVNRVWRNFFGRGLIDPEDDLRATNPASDEPLMEWLTSDFLARKFDVKHLIRTIMTSAVYARSSLPVPGNADDAKFLSHYPVKRLPAEVILDAVSQVTGVPSKFNGYPAGWRSLQLPDSKVDSGFLSSFGRPDRLNTCSCERSSEPSMTQALHLANGETVNEKLRAENGIVAKILASKASDDQVIDDLFVSALSRGPTDAERERLVKILADSVAGLTEPKQQAEARRQAIEDLYWATLTGNEFLFNH